MALPNALVADAAGLQTQPSELSVGPGSLAVATNVEITRDGVVEVARGFEDFSTNLPDLTPRNLISVGGELYMTCEDGVMRYHNGTQWNAKPGGFTAGVRDADGCCIIGNTLYVAGYGAVTSVSLVTGEMRVIAGVLGTYGATNGVGTAARFQSQTLSLATDGTNLFVGDIGNNKIRKITMSTVTVSDFYTLASVINIAWSGSYLYACNGGVNLLRINASGTLIDTIVHSESIDAITAANSVLYVAASNNGKTYSVAIGAGDTFSLIGTYLSNTAGPTGLAATSSTLYLLFNPDELRSVPLTGGTSSNVAGASNTPGYVDGVGDTARFDEPHGMVLSSDGTKMYICDANNNAVRVVYLSNGNVTSLTGDPTPGTTNASNAWLTLGPDYSTSERRIRSAAMNGNTYFTSAACVYKSTSAASSLTRSGMPRALDVTLALSSAGTPVMLANGNRRAYRVVWGIRDANNNLVLGAPSSRVDISNTASYSGGGVATRDVTVSIYLPPEITTSHFVQIYATAITASTVDPGDEHRLIYEKSPTSSEVTAGVMTFLDIVPDEFRAADLYTNATQEGIAQQNDRPPLARDICSYRRKMLYANYTEPHRYELQLLGTTGMVANQTITIGGVVYTAKGTENTAAGEFLIYTAGTQSEDVEVTAKSLCACINRYAANTGVYAWYDSSDDDPPCHILIEERGVGGSAFTLTCSAAAIGDLFSPPIPASGTVSSSAERRVNRIRVSKFDEPEACPRGDEIVVGGEDEEIQRIIPLRTSVIVIKDRSVWSLSLAEPGEEPTFIDNTVSIAGRDSAAALNNVVMFLSNQGFVAASDNGVQLIGRPIENRILAGLEADDAPNHDTYVACGNEHRRLYTCTVYDPAQGRRTAYQYSPIANKGKGAWTQRTINASALAVLDDRTLYALNNANGHVLRQRASLRDNANWYRDFCEESHSFLISAVDTTAKTITGTLSGGVDYDDYLEPIGVGWKFYHGNNQHLVVSASGSYTLTLNAMGNLSAADIGSTLTLYRPVEWEVEWSPITAGNPLEMKQFVDVIVKAETANAYAIDFCYANQQDSKALPYADGWEANPEADRVFVPRLSQGRASKDNNDFELVVGTVVPYNTIRSIIPPQRAFGDHIVVRLSGGTAEGYVGIKALVVQVAGKSSNRTRA